MAPENHDLSFAETIGWLRHAVQRQAEDTRDIKTMIEGLTREQEAARREQSQQLGGLTDRVEQIESQVAAFAPIATAWGRWRDRSWGLVVLGGLVASIGISLLSDLGSAILDRLLGLF